MKPAFDLVDAKSGKTVAPADRKITALAAKRIVEGGTEELLLPTTALEGKFLARDIVNRKTGEIYGESGDLLEEELLAELREQKVKAIEILDVDNGGRGPWLRNTLKADKNDTRFRGAV